MNSALSTQSAIEMMAVVFIQARAFNCTYAVLGAVIMKAWLETVQIFNAFMMRIQRLMKPFIYANKSEII